MQGGWCTPTGFWIQWLHFNHVTIHRVFGVWLEYWFPHENSRGIHTRLAMQLYFQDIESLLCIYVHLYIYMYLILLFACFCLLFMYMFSFFYMFLGIYLHYVICIVFVHIKVYMFAYVISVIIYLCGNVTNNNFPNNKEQK